jgi:hypothetical protein
MSSVISIDTAFPGYEYSTRTVINRTYGKYSYRVTEMMHINRKIVTYNEMQ